MSFAERSDQLRPWWLAAVLLPMLLLGALLALDRPIPESAPWITEASLQTDRGWQPIELRWRDPAPERDTQGVIQATAKINLDLPTSVDQTWAILVPQAFTAYRLSLDGELVAEVGRIEPPVSWLRWPQLTVIPPGLLRPGDTELRIETFSEAATVTVPRLLIGPEAELRPIFERRRLIGVVLPRITVIAMSLLAAMLLGLYLLRREDTVYAWFSATLLIWALHTAHDQVQHLPIANRHIWFSLSYLSLGWFVIVATLFIHRILQVGSRRMDVVLVGLGALGSLVLLALASRCGNCFYGFAQRIWVPALLLTGAYAVFILFRHVRQQPEYTALIPAAVLVVVVGVRDYLWELRVIPWGSTYYLSYAAAVAMTIFAAILLRRFADALEQSETLNRELEQKVQEKTEQIGEQFAATGRAEQARARLEERQRIVRDMHDSLGADLVQALAIIDADESSAEARGAMQRCLTSLRLGLDAADSDGEDILALISNFRYRIDRAFQRAGVTLSLDLAELPFCTRLSGADHLHVVRILQEAASNVLKHARASRVHLRVLAGPDNASILIEFRDNGRGIADATSAEPRGRGINNIRWRSEQLGATVGIDSDARGTQLTLCIPLIVNGSRVAPPAPPSPGGSANV